MIGAPDGHLRLGNGPDAIDRAVVGAQYWRPAIHGLVADLALLPAQVLPQCPGVVDTPGHLRGQGLLLGVVLVESGLADEALAADLAIGCAEHGAAVRQEGAGGATVVLLHVGHQCPFELLVGAPGQRRHEQQAVVLGVIDLSLAVTLNRHYAIQQCAVVIERASAVEGDLLAVETAVLQLQLILLFRLRTLADQAEQTAHRTLTVEHRRRPLEHFDTLQGKGVGAGVGVGADALLQAVEEDGRRHAAHQREITATVEAIGLATHARHVAQRVLDGQRTLVADAIGGDHADRLRRLDDWRIGLGCADATLGDVAFHRAVAPLGLARRGDLLCLQLDCLLRLDGEAGNQHGQTQHQRAQRKRGRSDGETHGVLPCCA